MKQKEEQNSKVLLLFSGGLDTTLEAMGLAERYREVHLLTFQNGFCLRIGSASRSANELRKLCGPDKIIHDYLNTYPWIKSLLPRFGRLWKKYRSPLIIDMFCKAGAIAAMIEYGIRREIFLCSDGSSKDQTQVFIQHPAFREHIKPCVREFGLQFMEPIYGNLGRREKYERLIELGFKGGKKWLEKLYITSQLFHQPFCLIGFSTYFFTSPTRDLPFIRPFGLSLEEAGKLWDELWPEIRSRLNQRLKVRRPE